MCFQSAHVENLMAGCVKSLFKLHLYPLRSKPEVVARRCSLRPLEQMGILIPTNKHQY